MYYNKKMTTKSILLKRLKIVGPRTAHLQMVAMIECKTCRIVISSNKTIIYKHEIVKDFPSASLVNLNIVLDNIYKNIDINIYVNGILENHQTLKNKKYIRYLNKIQDSASTIVSKIGIKSNKLNPDSVHDYNTWLKNNEKPSKKYVPSKTPLVSILVPVYNTEEKFLRECIESALGQTYKNIELCLADDNSSDKKIKPILEEYKKKDPRVKVIYRKENGNISEATNSALDIASGEFVALLDNDDVLAKNAIEENIRVINERDVDFIYSDEDKLNEKGKRCYPHFKPDWSPDTILSLNYITHLAVIRTSIVKKIGGFRTKYNGAQDHDLFLRVSEQTEKIYHIRKILYHWRMSKTSTAASGSNKEYASNAGLLAVTDALKRRDKKAEVRSYNSTTSFIVKYDIKKTDMVSIIIPTKDNSTVLKRCIDSIKKYADCSYEIIVVNNNSEKPESFKYYNLLQKQGIKVLTINKPFNYSLLNNEAVREAKGHYLLFLNDDTEAIMHGWLSTMLGYASQNHIGAVGVKLFYPGKEYIQHAGVVIGAGGVAGHIFSRCDSSYEAPFGRTSVPYNYSAVTGACLMLKKEKFNKIKGFDESLEVAFNDVDLCLKLLDVGYYNICLPQVTLIHHESLSRGLDNIDPVKIKRFNSEISKMQKKWKESITKDRFYNPNYSLDDVTKLYLA